MSSEVDVRAEQGCFYVYNHEAILTKRLRYIMSHIDSNRLTELRSMANKVREAKMAKNSHRICCKIVFEGEALAARDSANGIRRRILGSWYATDAFILDMTSVRTITHSYADELFGVLSVQVGEKSLLKKLTVNGSNEIKECIANALMIRREEGMK